MADRITDEERALIDQALAIREDEPAEARRASAYIERRRERVRALFEAGATANLMAEQLGVSEATINLDKKALGLTRSVRRGSMIDVVAQKRVERSKKGVKEVRDRRRFKVQPVAMGQPARMAPAGLHNTVFPTRIFEPDGSELVLKDGSSNAKIGGDVLVGWLKGAYIVTLTLEERATCPKSCPIYRGCYGNVMPHSRRWVGGEKLESQIVHEIGIACAKNERVLVRLHILGDFYSVEYLQLWADLLDKHPNLYVFGFSAWEESTPIGRGIAWLRDHAPNRFMVRTSGRTGRWGSFTLPFPTEAKRIGDAIVCPEQLDANEGSPRGRHCGNCGICWSTDLPIAFIEH